MAVPATATATATSTQPTTPLELEEKPIEEQLSYPIMLSERLRKSISEAVSFKQECLHLSKQVDRISAMLRSTVRLTTTTSQIYDRPIRRISADVSRNLDRSLSVVRRCRRRSFLHRVVNLVTAADFRKIFSLLDASIGDLKWLLSILDSNDVVDDGEGGSSTTSRGVTLSLPPIASNDPILSWIWSYIASIQMSELPDRVDSAIQLASLAQDNDRNKKIIVEEGGIPPLLKLLRENSSIDAQISASNALYSIANDEERVRVIVNHSGVNLVVQTLSDSAMKVQVRVADLVARMAEFDVVAKEEFARENAIRPLVSLLSFETFNDEVENNKFNFHSIVQINKDKDNKEKKKERRDSWSGSTMSNSSLSKPKLYSSYSSLSLYSLEGGGSGNKVWQNRKERENESPEVKRELKVNCAKALWMLARDCVMNSKRITETKGLLCLAKLIEKGQGELQKNCLMAIMEITTAAESNPDLRRSAFKTNSPAAKAVVEQVLRVIKESSDLTLQIAGLRSIGCLSRTFPARETRVIGPLVDQLSNKDQEVATEAAIALGKFTSPENFLCHEHSKAIIEFHGVLPLMRLLRVGDEAQLHGLVLLCYLAIHASESEALEQARVLNALEGADRTVQFAQMPHLRDLITKAIYHLSLYRSDVHSLRQPSLRY